MKKTILLLIVFVSFTLLITSCSTITLWDTKLIMLLQNSLKDIPLWIPLLPDYKLYTAMIVLPLILGTVYFIKIKKYVNIAFLYAIPLITFLLNCIIKPLIHRIRPPYELQQSIHPDSFSYVSSHSLVTFCLWGTVIYYLNKYCKNTKLKIFSITISILWILFVGVSRIWLGVHHPSDVLGAYLLGFVLLNLYINTEENYEKRFGNNKF